MIERLEGHPQGSRECGRHDAERHGHTQAEDAAANHGGDAQLHHRVRQHAHANGAGGHGRQIAVVEATHGHGERVDVRRSEERGRRVDTGVAELTAPDGHEQQDQLEGHRELVSQRDDLSVELADLYNQTQRPELALEWLQSRVFQPWEGGEGEVLVNPDALCFL